MELIPDDADICVCTDLDEVFESGWREKLENAEITEGVEKSIRKRVSSRRR